MSDYQETTNTDYTSNTSNTDYTSSTTNTDSTTDMNTTTETAYTDYYTAESEVKSTSPDLDDKQLKKLNRKHKTKKVFGVLLVIISVLLFFFTLLGSSGDSSKESTKVPKMVGDVTTEGEYVTDTMSYMTDWVANFTAAEDSVICLSIYDTETDFHITPICIKASEMTATFLPYLEWAYDVDAPEPEPYVLLGYSVPVEDDLKEYIIEGITDFYGFEFTEEMYSNYVMPVYIVIGDVKDTYDNFVMAAIFYVISAIALLFGCYFLMQKAPVTNSYDAMLTADERPSDLVFGIIGAIFGAAIGGVVWVLIGLGGMIVGYIGLLIFILAFGGFRLFCKNKDGFGAIYCFILSMVVVFVATFLVTVLQVHSSLNDGSIGYVSFGQGISFTIDYLKSGDASSFWKNVFFGELFVILAGGSSLAKIRKK